MEEKRGKIKRTINFSVVKLPPPYFVLMKSENGGKIDGVLKGERVEGMAKRKRWGRLGGIGGVTKKE